jgi:hypothetical protein
VEIDHTIDRSEFIMTYESRADAAESHHLLGQLAQNKLMPVVDEVLTSLCPEETIVKIDRIELDLGRIPYSTMAEDMERTLREKLKSLISAKIRDLTFESQRNSAGEGLFRNRDLRREQMAFYLINGFFPDIRGESPILNMDSRLEEDRKSVV